MEKAIREGMLFKRLSVFGCEFEIYYGYYDARDRLGKYNDPIPIYPDFHATPVYTKEGFPLATEMQDICPHYSGPSHCDSCYGCRHYRRGEELIGLCLCPARRRE